MSENYFKTLNAINVNEHTETKGSATKLTYLSWAWAWAEVKKLYPDTTYKVYENEHGWNYFTDGHTCWVKTGVTVNGIECIEYLPIMDYNNRSITQDKVTSFDVNKAIQRSLTKAVARHGLGLYIYAGEDLPEDAEKPTKTETPKVAEPTIDYKKELSEFMNANLIPVDYVCSLCSLRGVTPAFDDITEKQFKNLYENRQLLLKKYRGVENK